MTRPKDQVPPEMRVDLPEDASDALLDRLDRLADSVDGLREELGEGLRLIASAIWEQR